MIVIDATPLQTEHRFRGPGTYTASLLDALMRLPHPAPLGLLMQPPRPAEESDQPADWPILPLRGEPPLNFFRGKRIVVLPAGTTVVRFGNETGNLVHAESARFIETSLAFERERERRPYRIQRALRVLTGVTAPWNGLPGGAIAYLLPRPLAQHIEAGAVSRL